MRTWLGQLALLAGLLFFLDRLTRLPSLPEAFLAAALAVASVAVALGGLEVLRERLPEAARWTRERLAARSLRSSHRTDA